MNGRRYNRHGGPNRIVKAVIAFLVYIIGLLGTLALAAGGLTYIVVAVTGRRRRSLRLPAAIASGFFVGALFVWMLVPRSWPLPLWTTLAAAGNAEKYGHPVEHSAEGIVVWMMFGAVVGAAGGGIGAGAIGGCRKRRRN
jgi:hypothetical protein